MIFLILFGLNMCGFLGLWSPALKSNISSNFSSLVDVFRTDCHIPKFSYIITNLFDTCPEITHYCLDKNWTAASKHLYSVLFPHCPELTCSECASTSSFQALLRYIEIYKPSHYKKDFSINNYWYMIWMNDLVTPLHTTWKRTLGIVS